MFIRHRLWFFHVLRLATFPRIHLSCPLPCSLPCTRGVASGGRTREGQRGPARTSYPPVWSRRSEFRWYTYQTCSRLSFYEVPGPQSRPSPQPGPLERSSAPDQEPTGSPLETMGQIQILVSHEVSNSQKGYKWQGGRRAFRKPPSHEEDTKQ